MFCGLANLLFAPAFHVVCCVPPARLRLLSGPLPLLANQMGLVRNELPVAPLAACDLRMR